ncbi:hypothetical protein QBC43DRAFT_138353 [Cladorrhinum sp. PSN259]|nr:hypothetical protein QBC43DRAFT_138353 [Cladorrhinum sp. PSN259]
MPVQVWDLLPESPAVSFVGFITTDNDGPKFQKEVDALLSKAQERTGVPQGNSNISEQLQNCNITLTSVASIATLYSSL